MLIHVNVGEVTYEILSREAEEKEMSVGQYCAFLVTDCADALINPPKEVDPE